MRPNWFFAFPIDGSFLLSLPAVPKGIRRYAPSDVHLTLAFLGPCGESGAELGLSALDEALSRAPCTSIDITLANVVPMGSRRSYSALSALLDRGREETENRIRLLRDVVTEAAAKRREKRPPKAHVTLARPRRRATDAEREAGLRWASELDLARVRTTLSRIALYTWSDNRRESLFRIVAERPLGRVSGDARGFPDAAAADPEAEIPGSARPAAT